MTQQQVPFAVFPVELLTDLAAGAAHSGAVLLRGLHSCVCTGPGVLGKAQVIVRAHVDDVPHHAACVSDTNGHVFPSSDPPSIPKAQLFNDSVTDMKGFPFCQRGGLRNHSGIALNYPQ